MKKKYKVKIKKLLKIFKKIKYSLNKKNLIKEDYKNINKKYNKIKKIINCYFEIKKYKKLILESKKLIKFDEIKQLALEDINKSKNKILNLKKIIKNFFLKKKKREKIFLEIKNGTGGEESSMFAKDLLKMYLKYIEKKKWKFKIISYDTTNLGGYKNIIISINGKSVYNNLKYESGVHRVQRFPKTENSGRIHTSTCKVAIFPELKYKIKINKKDFKIETFKSSGSGGQHVNKTNSAVRIKHIPTKISVECQNERSQHKNKKEGMKLIKSKIIIFNNKKNEFLKKNIKKKLFGTGERSEKIRTYNYIKNRLTEHRINLNLYKLDYILNGNLDEIIKLLKKINVIKK